MDGPVAFMFFGIIVFFVSSIAMAITARFNKDAASLIGIAVVFGVICAVLGFFGSFLR
jgi:hypothetical protein